MGIAVCTLLKHDLDTSGMEALAAQLAARLDATIIYGYIDDWDYERNGTYDFVVKGYAGTGVNIYILRQEHYYECAMGVEIAYGARGEQSLIAVDKHPHYDLGRIPQGEDEHHIHIYKECFDPGICHGAKWPAFIRNFTGDKYGWQDESVPEFRKEVHYWQQLLGCEQVAYYYPDTYSEAAELESIAYEGNWADILGFIEAWDGQPVFDLGKWYRDNGDSLKHPPEIIKDDFSDLVPG